MPQKYYAVKKGRCPGIYNSWTSAQNQVEHYPGALFRSFTTREAAHNYLNSNFSNSSKRVADIIIYTDGGSRNHGVHKNQHVKSTDRAAWAFLICRESHKISGTNAEWGATNNRMEVMAFLRALQWLLQHHWNHQPILEVADSRYVLNAITKGWLSSWQRRNWHLASGAPVKNAGEWKTIAKLLPQFDNLSYKWTKGHAKDQGNIFVDHLLNRTMDRMIPGRPLSESIQRSSAADQSATTKKSVASPVSPNSIEALKADLKRHGFFND